MTNTFTFRAQGNDWLSVRQGACYLNGKVKVKSLSCVQLIVTPFKWGD